VTRRSTRNKIRSKARTLIEHFDKLYQDLKDIDDLAGGQSDYINENVPILYSFIKEIKRACERFADGL